MTTSPTALTPLEQTVLDAIAATGQGDGRLHTVSAVARRIERTDEAVNRTNSHPVPTAIYFRQKDIAGNIEVRRVWPS